MSSLPPMPPLPAAPKWFDYRISVGNLITIFMVAMGLSAGWAELRADNRKQDADIAALHLADADNRQLVAETIGLIRSDVSDLRHRLNELTEKMADKLAQTTARLSALEATSAQILSAVKPPRRIFDEKE